MAELQSLPGIGPVLAERIIIARREKVFLEIRDLLRVSGIGEKRLAQIADLICLYIPRDAEAE
ncbi:MAG TPA: helix-hairpin-helix domain-containing protein [Firmicutes bacterium]|nr:helix-hairpin-helix domain-containing protein [Bacillota bacterium]